MSVEAAIPNGTNSLPRLDAVVAMLPDSR